MNPRFIKKAIADLHKHTNTFSLGALALALICCVPFVHAEDVLIRHRADGGTDRRLDYHDQVLAEAMRRTQKEFGPYRIQQAGNAVVRERLLAEMVSGAEINVTVVASQPAWEEKLIPIWIPIDLGLTSYRIALIDRKRQPEIATVKTLQDLKALTIGAGAGWSSRKVFEQNGFHVETGEDYDALLKMLLSDRFDYFPRGVNEIFIEYDDRSKANPDLAIEQDLIIYFPLPTYVFVSPQTPHLAKRLEAGMESMVRDGTLLKMMMNFHADMLQRANFCARRIFRIDNPLVSAKTPLDRKELWFDPYDPKTGMCKPKAAKRVIQK